MDVALEELGAAKALDPAYPKLYNIYGLVYAMLGDREKAEENFQAGALRSRPAIRRFARTGAPICARPAARAKR